MEEKMKLYEHLLKPKPYVCRVYILRGIFIGGQEPNKDMYLKMKLAGTERILKSQTLKLKTCNPDFYIMEELPCEIPGSAFLSIEVINNDDESLIGSTNIDLEDRFFTKKWFEMNMDIN